MSKKNVSVIVPPPPPSAPPAVPPVTPQDVQPDVQADPHVTTPPPPAYDKVIEQSGAHLEGNQLKFDPPRRHTVEEMKQLMTEHIGESPTEELIVGYDVISGELKKRGVVIAALRHEEMASALREVLKHAPKDPLSYAGSATAKSLSEYHAALKAAHAALE